MLHYDGRFRLKHVVLTLRRKQTHLVVIDGHLLYRYHHLSKFLSKRSRNYYKCLQFKLSQLQLIFYVQN